MSQPQNTGQHLVSHIGKNDYRAAVYFNNLYGKKRAFLPMLFVGIFMAVFRVAGRVLGFMPSSDLFFYACVGYLVLILAIFLLSEWQIVQFAAQVKALATQEQKLFVNEEGVTDESEGVGEPVLFPWKTIAEAYELKDLFLLYMTKQRAILIPKGELGQEGRTQLRQTFIQRLGERFVRCTKHD